MNRHTSTPNILLIGAAKSGSSSLAADLAANSQVYMPDCKEPHCLTSCHSPSEIKQKYKHYYGLAQQEWRLDASTGYSMRDRHQDVADKALTTLGAETKIVYIVRNPVDRSLSHHFHLVRNNHAPVDFMEAYRAYPELVSFGLYAYQLSPWLDRFPRKNINIVLFEEYIADKSTVVRQLFQELGIPTTEREQSKISSPRNVGEETASPAKWSSYFVKPIMNSDFYKRHRAQPIFKAIRNFSRKHLMTKSCDRPLTRESDIQFIVDQTRDDCEEFFGIIGRRVEQWVNFNEGQPAPEITIASQDAP